MGLGLGLGFGLGLWGWGEGWRRCSFTAASLARMIAPAPSQMPEAEAGVTTPPFLNGVGSLASFSMVAC